MGWTLEDGREVAIIDKKTGEIIDSDGLMVTRKVPAGRDFWWRFMVTDLVKLMDDLPGKQIHAISAVLDAVQPGSNLILASIGELASAANCSEKTMWLALKALREHGIVKKERGGVYMIDPRFMLQGGGRQKFSSLTFRYDAIADTGTGGNIIDMRDAG